MEKLKVTPQMIVQVIELVNTNDDSSFRDESNRTIAFHILNNLDWNFNNNTHRFYIMLLWYAHLGDFAEKQDSSYEIEMSFGENIVKEFNLSPYNRSDDNFDTQINKSDITKAKYFYKKYMSHFNSEVIAVFLISFKSWLN